MSWVVCYYVIYLLLPTHLNTWISVLQVHFLALILKLNKTKLHPQKAQHHQEAFVTFYSTTGRSFKKTTTDKHQLHYREKASQFINEQSRWLTQQNAPKNRLQELKGQTCCGWSLRPPPLPARRATSCRSDTPLRTCASNTGDRGRSSPCSPRPDSHTCPCCWRAAGLRCHTLGSSPSPIVWMGKKTDF